MSSGTSCYDDVVTDGAQGRSRVARNIALLAAHRSNFAARIRRRVPDDADRADLLQEVSLIVIRCPIDFTDARHFSNWCKGVIDHTVRRWQRSHVRRKRRELEAGEAASYQQVRVEDPELRAANKELVLRALAAVDDQDFGLLVARYVDCFTAEELAEIGSENPAAIRMRLSRLRDAARRALDPTEPPTNQR
jgi:RNA polymerase sigma factor (sigma-70 family)